MHRWIKSYLCSFINDHLIVFQSSTDFQIMKIGFLAFFEAKMTKIVILDQKLIVPNDYLQFWAHFEWFSSFFQVSEVK